MLVLLSGADQIGMGSPVESWFLSRVLPLALREFFATVGLGLLTGDLDLGSQANCSRCASEVCFALLGPCSKQSDIRL